MRVFEIGQKIKGSVFHFCFAESYAFDGENIILYDPFVHGFLEVSLYGCVECRKKLSHSSRLPRDLYQVAEVRCQPWMLIDATDLLIAHDFCTECDTELPTHGFNRFRDA